MNGTLFAPYGVNLSNIIPTATSSVDGTWARKIAQAQLRGAGLAGSVLASLFYRSPWFHAEKRNIELPSNYFWGTRPPFVQVAVQYGSVVHYRKIVDKERQYVRNGTVLYGSWGLISSSMDLVFTTYYELEWDEKWYLSIFHDASNGNLVFATNSSISIADYILPAVPQTQFGYLPYSNDIHRTRSDQYVYLHYYIAGAHPYMSDADTPTFWYGGKGTWATGTGAGPVTYGHHATYNESWGDVSTFSVGIPTGTGLYTALVVAYFGNDPFNAWIDGTLGTFLGSLSDVYPNIAMYGFLNPPTGTKSISATFSGLNGVQYTAVTFRGVNQTSPVGSVCVKSEGWAATCQYYSPCGTGNVVCGGLVIGNSGNFYGGTHIIELGNWSPDNLTVHHYATYVSGSTVHWFYGGAAANSLVSMSAELKQA